MGARKSPTSASCDLVMLDQTVCERVADGCRAVILAESCSPIGIGTADGRCRAIVRIETQKHQGRCAPSPPLLKTGSRHTIASEPGHGGACHGFSVITRARDNCNRHGPGDGAPAMPAVKLRQIIRSHQPDKPAFGIAAHQSAKGFCGVARAQMLLDRGWCDRRIARLRFGRAHPRCERRHAFLRFQRISGRYQPPYLIKAERMDRKLRDTPMPAMRRIEAAAKNAGIVHVRIVGL